MMSFGSSVTGQYLERDGGRKTNGLKDNTSILVYTEGSVGHVAVRYAPIISYSLQDMLST